MNSEEAKVMTSRQVISQLGATAYRNGKVTMNASRITMSRPLNVPTGGRSIRTRRKYSREPTLTSVTPVRMTPNSVRVCWRREIGSDAMGESRSHECWLAGEGGLAQVASGVPQRGGLIITDNRQVHVQAGVGEVAAGRGLAVVVDGGGRQGELDPAVAGGGAIAGGPLRGGQRLDRVDQLPWCDRIGRAELQQVVGLAENLAGGRHAGQLAAECSGRQAARDVAGVIAEDGRAITVGEVRGDHDGAERTGSGGLAGLQVKQLGQPDVDVVVQVAMAAGPRGDRDHLGHAVRVVDLRHAERLAGGAGQARRQYLPADGDAPQPEVARAHAAAPGGRDEFGEVARVGRQDSCPAAAEGVQSLVR